MNAEGKQTQRSLKRFPVSYALNPGIASAAIRPIVPLTRFIQQPFSELSLEKSMIFGSIVGFSYGLTAGTILAALTGWPYNKIVDCRA